MAFDENLFGPMNEEEKEEFTLEALVFSVQVALQRAMNKHGVTNKELAARLGLSPARVSQIFSDRGPNLTLKTIAKIQLALDEDFELVLRSDLQKAAKKAPSKSFRVIAMSDRKSHWQEVLPGNMNRKAEAIAA